MNITKCGLFAWTIVGIWSSAPAAIAADIRLSSKYKISFLGVKAGKLFVTASISGNSYKISGGGKTSNMVAIISDSRADFSSQGKIEGSRLIPASHVLAYKSGKKKGGIKMTFSAGDVVKADIWPVKKVKSGTVPVTQSHKLSVLDPISALLIAVEPGDIGNGRKICNKILPVFDGSSRMNIKISYGSSKKRKAEGFSGKTFTCALRYQPISGHRPHKKNVKFMQANRDLEITLARIGKSNVYGMFAFSVGTDKGTVSGYATRFALK